MQSDTLLDLAAMSGKSPDSADNVRTSPTPCRDCADNFGTCPHDGLSCEMKPLTPTAALCEKAKAILSAPIGSRLEAAEGGGALSAFFNPRLGLPFLTGITIGKLKEQLDLMLSMGVVNEKDSVFLAIPGSDDGPSETVAVINCTAPALTPKPDFVPEKVGTLIFMRPPAQTGA